MVIYSYKPCTTHRPPLPPPNTSDLAAAPCALARSSSSSTHPSIPSLQQPTHAPRTWPLPMHAVIPLRWTPMDWIRRSSGADAYGTPVPHDH